MFDCNELKCLQQQHATWTSFNNATTSLWSTLKIFTWVQQEEYCCWSIKQNMNLFIVWGEHHKLIQIQGFDLVYISPPIWECAFSVPLKFPSIEVFSTWMWTTPPTMKIYPCVQRNSCQCFSRMFLLLALLLLLLINESCLLVSDDCSHCIDNERTSSSRDHSW